MNIVRPTIGIVDPSCAMPYGGGLRMTKPLGGTEATVLKIVDALQGDFRFRLFQANAPINFSFNIDRPIAPLKSAFQDRFCQAFLVINSWKVAIRLRRFHPHTPISLWLHVHPGRHNRQMGAALAKADIDIICVSKSHATQLTKFLSFGPCPPISSIWNPISDALEPDATPRNLNRLFYCSSPHKGLKQVFAQFAAVRERLPDLSLEVADPGYLAWDVGTIPKGVWLRGSLPHDRLISRMRRALCLFYPQNSFAETFGLVIAEANAVGTPVLVQKGLGANDEIVCGQDQLIDVDNIDQLVARIKQWQTQFPHIRTHDKFRLSRVALIWKRKLTALVNTKDARVPSEIRPSRFKEPVAHRAFSATPKGLS